MTEARGEQGCDRAFTPASVASFLLALTVVLSLMIPAAAYADRDPTPSERAGIEQAAQREYGEPGATVKVSDIRVSTKNRSWAAANVIIDFGTSGQGFLPVFRRHGGELWTKKLFHIPAAIEEDLGLVESDGGGTSVATYVVLGVLGLLVLWGLGRLFGDGSSGGATGSTPKQPRQYGPTPTSPRDKNCPAGCNSGRVRCPRCNGTCYEPNFGTPPPPQIACRECGKTGSVECKTCHGTGKVKA